MRSALLVLVAMLLPAAASANDPEPGDAATTGQLTADPDAPRDFALEEHQDAADECFARAAGRRGAARARVTVTYRVTATGTVRGARVTEAPRGAARRCVLAALRRHRFPAADVLRVLGDRPEEREVRHTFVLAAVEGTVLRAGLVHGDQQVLLALLGSGSGSSPLADVLAGGAVNGTGGGRGTGIGAGGVGAGAPTAPAPTVRITRPGVRGSLSAEVVHRVLLAQQGAIRACYEMALGTAPTLAGLLAVHVVIGADGAVTSARLTSSDIVHEPMRACVTRQLRRTTFPAPEGGGIVLVDAVLRFAR